MIVVIGKNEPSSKRVIIRCVDLEVEGLASYVTDGAGQPAILILMKIDHVRAKP